MELFGYFIAACFAAWAVILVFTMLGDDTNS